MKKELKYNCICVGGGGYEQKSVWSVKIMLKTMKLECIDIENIWGNAERGQKFIVYFDNKKNKHPLRVWKEDLSDFTIYPNQAGTPYHFKKA